MDLVEAVPAAVLGGQAPDGGDAAAVAVAVRRLLAVPLDLPRPGHGRTGERFHTLRRVARWNLVVGRLIEAHADAAAILDDLAGPPVEDGQWWGVWAAEPPDPVLTATRGPGGWRLDGRKAWCSGAGSCTHAMVTAQTAEGRRLFATALDASTAPVPGSWPAVGMAGSDTRSMDFHSTAAEPVGEPGAYLDRPGFWHGAAGVAACWLGGAEGLLRPLLARAAANRLDEHGLAHLGACDAAVHAASMVLQVTAEQADSDPLDIARRARIEAMRSRAVVEHAVGEVLTRVGRALGAGPLCSDAAHARLAADLPVYVRQSHGERDLAALGRLVGMIR
jgi:alkylation response protein AidB-like acyl-CoA dehydrogenase